MSASFASGLKKTQATKSLKNSADPGGIMGTTIDTAIALRPEDIGLIKNYVSNHPLVKKLIRYKCTTCMMNGGLKISINGNPLEEHDKNLAQIRNIVEWTVAQYDLYGFAACQILPDGRIRKLTPGTDYTLKCVSDEWGFKEWRVFSMTDKTLENVVLSMIPVFEPDMDTGRIASPGIFAKKDLEIYDSIKETNFKSVQNHGKTKTFLQPNNDSDTAKKLLDLDTDVIHQGDQSEITSIDHQVMQEKLKGVEVLGAYIQNIKNVQGEKPFSGVTVLPPFVSINHIEPVGQLPNYESLLRLQIRLIMAIFEVPENKLFPQEVQLAVESYRLSEQVGNNAIQALQVFLSSFAVDLYIAQTFSKFRESIVELTEEDALAAWNSYNVTASFDNNPYLDPDSMDRLLEKKVITVEGYRQLNMTYFGLPKSMEYVDDKADDNDEEEEEEEEEEELEQQQSEEQQLKEDSQKKEGDEAQNPAEENPEKAKQNEEAKEPPPKKDKQKQKPKPKPKKRPAKTEEARKKRKQ